MLEQRCEILRHYLLRFWQKKNHLFRWSAFWSWRVRKQAKVSHLGHRKPTRMHWKADAPKTSHCLVRILVQKHNFALFLRKWVSGNRYRAILNEFLFTKIEEQDNGNIWFQQDGTTCHIAEAILDVLRPIFEDFNINRRADVVLPPRSCNLTPLDCWLYFQIKKEIWENIHQFFLKAFSQKKGIWRTLYKMFFIFDRSYTRCFAPCYWRSHYQPQSRCRFTISELRFDAVGLLFVGYRQR